MASTDKQVIVVGIDEGEYSYYALQWSIDHIIIPSARTSPFKFVVIHSKPTAASAVGISGPGAADVLSYVDADLKRTAARIIAKAKEICYAVDDVIFEVVEGDARDVLCEAAEKHHASVLVVGSHGYGAIKRAVLGSVGDYCVHHAHCSVMIVKKPKHL